MQESRIISVKEARKLAGKSVESITNDELELLIADIETVVNIILDGYIRSKSDRIKIEP